MNETTQWFRMSWTAMAMWSLVGGLVAANELVENEKQPTPRPAQVQPTLEKARDLLGAAVVNPQGDRLGKVDDIVLTRDRRQIGYVALSHGGFLGIGSKLFAVPWSAFEVRTENRNKVLVLDVMAQHLDDMEGFDKSHWPASADTATWTRSVRSPETSSDVSDEESGTLAAKPGESWYPVIGVNIPGRRLSKLLGLDIKSPQGESLGELQNAVITVDRGDVAYGIVLVGTSYWDMDLQVAPVPWPAIQITDHPLTARLNADKEMLAAIAFNADNYPDLASPQYSREIYQRFNVTPYWQTLGYVPPEARRERNTAPSDDADTMKTGRQIM